MKNEKAPVKEDKDLPRQGSSCFEGPSFAEMMEKIVGQEGIGSLCTELMRSLVERGHEGTEAPPGTDKNERHETIHKPEV
jgi:hypothetical protein